MNMGQKLGAGTAAALMLMSLAACGGSKGTSAASGPSTSAKTTTPAATATRTTSAATTGSTPSGSRGAAAGATGTKSCPGGDTSGVIGGKSRCLHAGQECSEKHAADYSQYGFACTQQGQKYILTKK